jgi:hypothetical protein
MSGRLRKWMVVSILLGALAFAAAPSAQAQYQNYPQDRRDDDRRNNDRYERDRRDGTRGDFRDYQREIRNLENRIWRDKEEIRLDSRRYGSRSFQVRADRERLKRDERELKQLKKDMKRYQKNSQRRNDRRPYRY